MKTVLAAVLILIAAPAAALECALDAIIIQHRDGMQVRFEVEIADTPAERAKGLMFRKEVPKNGMLFIYEKPQPVAFWMKNTLIPLDMIFIDERGRVRHVHKRAVPHDETPIPGNLLDDPSPDRLMVLEVQGGLTDRMDLIPGAVVAHPAIPQATAALPCVRKTSDAAPAGTMPTSVAPIN